VFTEVEADGDAKVVVLSEGFWRRRFGGDCAVTGRSISIDREPYTIVGVMQADFDPAFTATEFWTPLSIPQGAPPTLLTAVQTIALLQGGTTAVQARDELNGMLEAMRGEAPALLKGWTAGVVDLREAQYGSRRPAMQMLIAAVAALALIAIANLANLTLVDVLFRRADFAIRAALGASRRQLAAPEIVQSLIVAVVGGIAGLVFGAWIVRTMLALDPATAAGLVVTIDWRVALCGLGAALLVMLFAVALPVVRLAGPGLAADMSTGHRRVSGDATRIRIALVTAQTGLAIVLLSSGALVVATLQRSTTTDPGFDASNVVTAQLRLSATVLPTDTDRATFIDQVLQRLKDTPGIVDAATTLNPFTVGDGFFTMVHVENRPSADGQPYVAQFRRVSPGYFDTMRIRILEGRAFDRHDVVNAQPVAIVSRSFARRFWPTEDPIGRRIKRGSAAKVWSVIVGVADDARDAGLDQAPRDAVYAPFFQGSNAAAPVALVVRTAGDPSASIRAIQRAVWAVDRKQPLGNITTLQQFLDASLGPQRFRAMLITACGVLGLMLATIGTYGVTARSVVERTREVGIRRALGGGARDVWWSVARGSLRAVAIGALLGAGASNLAGAILGTLLPELRGSNWVFGLAAAAALLVIGAGATLLAARPATSVDPLRAIQAD
jgi:putative ABC transport system permease protein